MLTIGCATIRHDSFHTIDKLKEADFNKLNGRLNNPDYSMPPFRSKVGHPFRTKVGHPFRSKVGHFWH